MISLTTASDIELLPSSIDHVGQEPEGSGCSCWKQCVRRLFIVQELVTFFICVLCQRLKKHEFFRFNKCVLLNWRTMEEKVISRVEECLVFVASVFDFLYAHRVSCDVFITSPFYINKYTSYNLHWFCCTDPWLESDVELQAVPLRTVGTSELVSGGCTCG